MVVPNTIIVFQHEHGQRYSEEAKDVILLNNQINSFLLSHHLKKGQTSFNPIL